MSFINLRSNIFSLISNEFISELRKQSKQQQEQQRQQRNLSTDFTFANTINANNISYDLSRPKNLASTSNININCTDNNNNCKLCLENIAGISIEKLNNYIDNKNEIEQAKVDKCSGICTCEISNIDINTNLLFTVGTNINFTDEINTTISKKIVSDITTGGTDINKTTTYNNNWWALAGVGIAGAAFTGGASIAAALAAGTAGATGAIGYEATSKDYVDIEKNVKNVVQRMSSLYTNSINQLITSSQVLQIEGTGVKVHNVSIQSIQNILMKAAQINCSSDNNIDPENCISNSLTDLTNSIMKRMVNEMQSTQESLLKSVWNANKKIIYISVGFFGVLFILYIYLIIKKALSK